MDSFFLNLSGLYARDALSGGSFVDLSDMEGTCCYCDPQAEEILKRSIADLPLRAVHFTDSGDYHYVSKLFTDRLIVPFTLVLFDNHPDMQAPAFGDILSCGGWVRKALEENAFLEGVVIVGSDPSLAGETEGFGGRVTLLPADVDPSALAEIVKGRRIYISIDKDVLSREYARTDWSQGTMTLPQLLTLMNVALRVCGKNILGVDVCGGLSEAKGGQGEDFRINATADRAISDVFAKL